MPTWGEILEEIQGQIVANEGKVDIDGIRRKYLKLLAEHTGRNVILYSVKFTTGDPGPASLISVSDEDIHGLMEVMHGLDPKAGLDLILHTPGGSIEAAESFVCYLRSKFSCVRVIVPHLAMSAGTMIACASDEVVLGKHSFLGPIDPQFILETPLGVRMIPAQAILDQFELAKGECRNPETMGAWLPMLNQYGPDLYMQCLNALKLSRTVVKDWLCRYMFKEETDKEKIASEIGDWLANHQDHSSHSRHISREILVGRGFKISLLETDQTLQDRTLSVFHATNHTFNGTAAVKIIENHLGKAFIKTNLPKQMMGQQ